jgi:hypothetical protein
MLDRRPVLHTIILQARSAWTCIFSSQLVWISFQGNQIFCAMMMKCISQHGLSIPSAESTRFCAGCRPDWQLGLMNFGQALCIPPKRGLEWTAGELNAILESNLVPNHNNKGRLRTFCCIRWECELYSGRPKARCYPFNLSGHRFREKYSQVFHIK